MIFNKCAIALSVPRSVRIVSSNCSARTFTLGGVTTINFASNFAGVHVRGSHRNVLLAHSVIVTFDRGATRAACRMKARSGSNARRRVGLEQRAQRRRKIYATPGPINKDLIEV